MLPQGGARKQHTSPSFDTTSLYTYADFDRWDVGPSAIDPWCSIPFLSYNRHRLWNLFTVHLSCEAHLSFPAGASTSTSAQPIDIAHIPCIVPLFYATLPPPSSVVFARSLASATTISWVTISDTLKLHTSAFAARLGSVAQHIACPISVMAKAAAVQLRFICSAYFATLVVLLAFLALGSH